MADDKRPGSNEEPDKSIPADVESTGEPGGASLANPHLPEPEGAAAVDPSEAPELSDNADLGSLEDEEVNGVTDDPETPDVNEAKLERATNEVSDGEPASPTARPRRERSTRPVRKSAPETTSESRGGASKAPAVREQTKPGARPAKADRGKAVRKGGKPERTGPVGFVNEAVGELRKVVWPTGTQVQQYFVVVLVFVLFIITLVSLLDLGFGWLVLKVFG